MLMYSLNFHGNIVILQMSLQSLEGTVAALSFTDDLHKWHKQLQTIEAVLGIWLKIQLLWVQLEEVWAPGSHHPKFCEIECFTTFIETSLINVQVYGSSEVQQHLPNHVYTFSNVDREWRELMKATSKNPAVINVCLKEGELYSVLKRTMLL